MYAYLHPPEMVWTLYPSSTSRARQSATEYLCFLSLLEHPSSWRVEVSISIRQIHPNSRSQSTRPWRWMGRSVRKDMRNWVNLSILTRGELEAPSYWFTGLYWLFLALNGERSSLIACRGGCDYLYFFVYKSDWPAKSIGVWQIVIIAL